MTLGHLNPVLKHAMSTPLPSAFAALHKKGQDIEFRELKYRCLAKFSFWLVVGVILVMPTPWPEN